VRRNYDWLTVGLLRDGLKANGQTDEFGVRCAAVVDVAAYISELKGVPNDRSLRNTVYGRLRNGRDWEKRTRDDGTKAGQTVFYVKGTCRHSAASSSASSSSAGRPPSPGSPRQRTDSSVLGRGGGGSSSPGASGGRYGTGYTPPAPSPRPFVPGGVPHFGGAEGHRSYFHTEAVVSSWTCLVKRYRSMDVREHAAQLLMCIQSGI